ncbi:MAG TPA: response regulator [Bacteroidia bacterium]|jgi:DNA-binding NtrC family response regulator|nr:response regulator [Bacteroidia bacterium]
MKDTKHLIFIVEDNEMYSTMLDYILSKENTHQFIRFNSGEKCMENIYLNPDVIILDYGLPGIDGLETLFNIKKYDAHIPVIILTGNRNLSVAKKLLDSGAFDYINKDDDDVVSLIIATMNNALSIAKQNDHAQRAKEKRYVKLLCGLLILILIILGIGIATSNSTRLFK